MIALNFINHDSVLHYKDMETRSRAQTNFDNFILCVIFRNEFIAVKIMVPVAMTYCLE